MYGCEEEEDAMTLFRAGRSMSIAAGQQADDVLNLYGNGTALSPTEHQHLCHEHQQVQVLLCFFVFDFV
jgi:hypothetical protein